MDKIGLLVALQEKKPDALEAAIEKYGGYVMAVVQHTLGSALTEQDKEELVADTFVTLWCKAATLAPDSNLKAWLAVVARNAALNKVRSIHHGEPLQENMVVVDDGYVTGRTEKRETANTVRCAIEALGEPDRTLFLGYYYHYQTIGQIADETGMKVSTIKSRLRRGREMLKKALVKEGYVR